MRTLLALAAAILVVVGVLIAINGSVIPGALLIIFGCLVGPGGYSLASRSR